MTNDTTPAPIGADVPRYKIGYRSDEWGERSSTPGGIPDPAGAWVRYDDHAAALASAAQPADVDADRAMRVQAAHAVADKQLADALDSLAFYRRRCELLQSWQSKMRDPERTIVCDILANGQILRGPDGQPDACRYALAAPAVTDDTHAFQNFHRALCERFGYTHDARDWRRDQVSLIEHIAKLAAPAAVAEPSERVAFEMWVRKSTTEVPHRDQYGFYDEPVSEWWKVWQARAAAPATQQEAAYTSVQLAEMVLSDCGRSSNYKPLLERVAGRIERHVERLLTAQQAGRAMRAAQPAGAQQSGTNPELLKFYGATTDAEPIAAQAAHIEKLQAKLTKTPSFAPQRVREG